MFASGDQLVYYRCQNEEKKIALTFDDGPHYKYTAEILDILKEYEIKATFFVVGELAERYPELIEREIREGHELGNHTNSHPKLTELSLAGLIGEIKETETILASHQYSPKLFRPPEGRFGKEVEETAEALGYRIILWSVDTRDWAHTPADKIVKNVMQNTKSGSIILCHDFIGKNSPTPEALRIFIPALLKEGYEFVTVSELIGDRS